MRGHRLFVAACFVLGACGRTERGPQPEPIGGGAAGQPAQSEPPDPDQAFAFGVAMPLDRAEPALAYACTSQGTIELGVTTEPLGRLSPDGSHWAVARPDGVDVIEAPSLSSKRLAGVDVDLETLRWSDDGGRLGYFAGGFPMLADGDGSGGRRLDVTLPDPDADVELPLVEWSSSGERVGFLARGVATTARRDGSSARILWRRAARVTITRGLAFSHDGSTAAVIDDADRRLVFVDTASLEVVETDLQATLTIHAWVPGDTWLLTTGSGSKPVLVNRTGRVLELNGAAAASPTAAEVAISEQGVRVLELGGGVDRTLIGSELDAGPLFFRSDGRAIQYLDVAAVRVVDARDGRLLAESPSWGSFGPGDWFASPRTDGLSLVRLGADAPPIDVKSGLPVKLRDGGGAWLKDERFALVDERGVHLISLDGSVVDVCPDVTRVAAYQVPRVSAY